MAEESDKPEPTTPAESDGAAPEPSEGEPTRQAESEPPAATLAETPEARAKLSSLAREATEEDDATRKRMVEVLEERKASVAKAEHPAPSAWAEPVVKVDKWITTIEERVLLFALGLEVSALILWVALRGFSLPATDARNLWVRIPFLVAIFAGAAGLLTRNQAKDSPQRKWAAPVAGGLGLVVAIATRGLGAEYFQNILNWVQNASALMLVGGLRGMVTRLTLWLALLGASLATSKGKHINIDVVMRFVPVRFRMPVALVGWLSAALMCITGAWGFVDQLALGEFRVERTEVCAGAVATGDAPAAECEVGPGKKLAGVAHEARRDLFLLGRQISLDVRSLPKVIVGSPYDEWLSPQEWNAWHEAGGWGEHYPADEVKAQILGPDVDGARLPAITIPGGEENPSGILIRDLNLVLPFGLFMIALRFLLRSVLAISGHVVVDPDAAHADDDDDPAPADAAAKEVV